MPILDISSVEALNNVRNRATAWPDGRYVANRFAGLTDIAVNPTFSISKADRFFTMGSCFARNLEYRLVSLGYDVPLATFRLSDHDAKPDSGVMNKYTVHSMANELRWAVDPSGKRTNALGHEIFLEDIFIHVKDDLWQDPHVHGVPASFDLLKEQREKMEAAMRVVTDCGVFIFTLGLAETWYDCKTDVYLNETPHVTALRREPDRYRVQVLDYGDIYEQLEIIYETLTRHCRADFRMLITVSPIPFKRTFTGDDALSANMYSKSVQRAAAEAFWRKHPNIDYFPSYEMVSLTDRNIAYDHDNIHVISPIVGEIMNRVITQYSPTKDENISDLDVSKIKKRLLKPSENLGVANGFYKEKDYSRAAIAYEGVLSLYGDELKENEKNAAKIALIWSLVRLRRNADALRRLRDLAAAQLSENFAKDLGVLYLKLGRPAEAASYLTQAAASASPEHAPHLQQLLESAHAALGSGEHRAPAPKAAEAAV
jgi:tetratricopeptide (TPR) repeat protein